MAKKKNENLQEQAERSLRGLDSSTITPLLRETTNFVGNIGGDVAEGFANLLSGGGFSRDKERDKKKQKESAARVASLSSLLTDFNKSKIDRFTRDEINDALGSLGVKEGGAIGDVGEGNAGKLNELRTLLTEAQTATEGSKFFARRKFESLLDNRTQSTKLAK